MPRFLIGSVLLAGLTAAGCSAPVRPSEAEATISAERLGRDLSQLTPVVAPGDSTAGARRARFAAARLRGLGLQPALHGSFLTYPASGLTYPASGEAPVGNAEAARSNVLAYLPGRNPIHASRLVLVAAELGTPAAPAVLGALGPLTEEARFTTVPERTVGVALWAPPGADGVRDFLSNPTWALDGIERVLLVAAEPARAEPSRRLFEAAGLTVEVVGGGEVEPADAAAATPTRRLARALRLSEVVYARTRAASVRETTPPDDPRGGPPDSVAVRG